MTLNEDISMGGMRMESKSTDPSEWRPVKVVASTPFKCNPIHWTDGGSAWNGRSAWDGMSQCGMVAGMEQSYPRL